MNDQADRHATRMAKKKAVIDANIAKADKEKGLLLILTGNGKGKSSSAFGMVARALGHGMKVGVAQFIKSRSDTGEEAFLGKQAGVEWHVLGEGFTWDTQNLERDMATAKQGWAIAQKMLADPGIQLVVLDELTYLLKYGWLDVASVINDLAARPTMQHVVVTGRAAPQALLDAADTVSEIADVKHAYRAGVKAQAGVDL
ncbi:MAG: cob(I)yrinic acid a,c-diamide adenosyltransferase [Pseudomonadota bacterium]|nr:cob(I)yrinic acid a,c-diamide adenosyltransferase [Pseudomonadota bacterium]MDP1903094.1 cob(I)yrinic acid a,c-diamide adenosyltransferase [Pseudomonadota bacterium]MDP2353084.1 cob(I)yrinic acid a,c-diamide adenosyltransferase [Pseudomonadota bacterium]